MHDRNFVLLLSYSYYCDLVEMLSWVHGTHIILCSAVALVDGLCYIAKYEKIVLV